jgi:hypothetical protein
MRSSPIALFVAAAVAGLSLSGCMTSAEVDGAVAPTTRPVGVAVVELFTSEGCSSCPPADRVLAALATEAARDGTPVYPLAFHVDYWDRLGWADRFASAEFSRRQHDYAAAARAANVYTPQMIVNGEAAGFVGSQGPLARRAVAAALARPAAAAVELSVARGKDAAHLRADYRVTGQTAGCFLNLAVVQTEVRTDVARGENAGRTLRHANVVRAFRTVDLKDPAGGVDLVLPADVRPADARVVGYVQDGKTSTVLGAAAATAP